MFSDMFKTTVTKQPKPKRICHGWWQPSSWEKGWLITSLTHMFLQRSCTKWDQFRSALECPRDSFLSKTLISAPQISCPSSAANGHRSMGRESIPRQINNIPITHTHKHKLTGGKQLGEHRHTCRSDVSFRAIRPNVVFSFMSRWLQQSTSERMWCSWIFRDLLIHICDLHCLTEL